MGVEGDALNILTGFLANREQRVVLDGQTSDWGSIEDGSRKAPSLDRYYSSCT
jgi:hypothetical protein